jgi:hypothetical protein
MSREEQQENALMRIRRYYDLHKVKYFTGFKPNFVCWWTLTF